MFTESAFIFVGIFFVAFLCGVVPYILKEINLPKGIFESITALSGGVLLGAALFHIFPEGVLAFSGNEDHQDASGSTESIVFVVLIGLAVFGLLVFIEGAVGSLYKNKTEYFVESKASSYLLLGSLSVHSVFAGMALGLESGTGESAFSAILFSILSHKGVAAFALGAAFVKKSIKTILGIAFVVLFSAMTPLGFLFGSFLEEIFGGFFSKATNGVFLSIAGGTFIYISIIDFIKKYSGGSKKNGFVYVFLFIIGTVLMAALKPHQH